MNLFQKLMATPDTLGPLFVRVCLGIVLFPHGMQKLLGWYGGPGFSETMAFFMGEMHINVVVAFVIIVLESIGSIALIFGFATRIVALGYAGLVMGIVIMVHWQYGFFMNWYGDKPGEGIEYFIFWFGMAVSLVFSGGGSWSADRLINKHLIRKA